MRIKKFSWLVITFICMWSVSFLGVVEASEKIQLDDIKIENGIEASRQPITNSLIELIGPEQEVTFYYNLHSTIADKDNKIVLNIRNSELLIEPSSITVSIDGQTITSKPLTGERLTQQLVIPLSGEELKKGIHSVTVSFYGVIMEGVCVEQGTSGNWMEIGIDSYFQLAGQMNDITQSLADYPSLFVGTKNSPVHVVIPDNASNETLNSGLTVAAYLAEQSNSENTIQLIRESSLKKIKGNVIFLGTPSEFSTPFMKNVLKQTDFPTDEKSLILSRHELVSGDEKVAALFVLAHSSAELEERVIILTNEQFTKQLSGEQLVIKTLPELTKVNNNRIVTFKKIGMPNLTLDRLQGQSQQFYTYAPVSLQPDQSYLLELHLKRSETIALKEELETLVDEDVELIVLLNDVPHSVDIRALTDDKNGVYTVTVPIDAKTIGENRMMSVQLVSSGLGKKNPCISTDENHWIYIADDSFFTFPLESKKGMDTFASFPSPFAGERNATTVILPDEMNIDDHQLLSLYRSISIGGQSLQLTLKKAKEVSKEDVKNQHLVFVGGPDVQPLLNEMKKELTISYDNESPDLQSIGFIQEAVDMFSWIQPSFWSTEHAMIVFDRSEQSKMFVDKEFLDFLRNTDEMSTVAVKMDNEQLYTNALQLEDMSGKSNVGESENENSVLSKWWIVGFAALLIFVIGLMLFVLRQRKRKE